MVPTEDNRNTWFQSAKVKLHGYFQNVDMYDQLSNYNLKLTTSQGLLNAQVRVLYSSVLGLILKDTTGL